MKSFEVKVVRHELLTFVVTADSALAAEEAALALVEDGESGDAIVPMDGSPWVHVCREVPVVS